MAKIILLGSYADSLLHFRGALIRRLIKEGHEVLGVTPPPKTTEVITKLESWGARFRSIPLDRTGIHPGKDLQTLLRLHQLFLREEPDVFLGYTIKPVVYGLLAAWLADIPARYAMITGLGTAFMEAENIRQFLLQSLASLLYSLSLRTSQKVIFQNPDDAYLFCARRLVGGPEEVALVNGSGVDLDHFRPASLPEHTSFLMIARLLIDKGVHEYVDAARQIRRHHPNVAFRLVGYIDESPRSIDADDLQSWIDEGVIEYLGRLKDVRPAIANCSVFVLPSYREGTPRTVLEAMAMARGIITTDVPGCRQTVDIDRNGFLVPTKDAQALARAMTHFIGEDHLIESTGRESRIIVGERFDVHKVNETLLDVLDLRRPNRQIGLPPIPDVARRR